MNHRNAQIKPSPSFTDGRVVIPVDRPKSPARHLKVRRAMLAGAAAVSVAAGLDAGGSAIADALSHSSSAAACDMNFSPDAPDVPHVLKKLHAEGHAEKVLNADGTEFNGSPWQEPADGTVRVEHVDPNLCVRVGGTALLPNGQIEK